MLLTFEEQRSSMQVAGWMSPVLQFLLPVVSFVWQGLGSLLVAVPSAIGSQRPVIGCYSLLGWCLFHPFMYAQQSNREFVLETVTIMGGLGILLSHFQLEKESVVGKAGLLGGKPAVDSRSSAALHADRVQMLSRIALVAIFLYYAFLKVHGYASNFSSPERDWAGPIAEGALICALLYLCALVIIGMKSRVVALLLALAMALSACYMHPFWQYYWYGGNYKMDGVEGMAGMEVDVYTYADHQRYFFFQTMSTVGALLLLVVHGPGKLSMDEQDGPVQLPTIKGGA